MPAFIIYMAGAAGIGLFKVLLVAGILPKEMFGNYVAIASGAMLLTMVMSAGLIEGTIKRFPRLWSENKADQIVTDVFSILSKVVLRTTVISAIAAIGMLLSGRIDLLIVILPGVFLGGAGLVIRLLSSAQLAIGSLNLLITFSMFRALVTFLFVVIGAWAFGFFGAVFGEVAAVIAVITQAWMGLKRYLVWKNSASKLSPSDRPDYRLYIGSVMTSGTMLADRPLVNLLSGSALAGSYGFAMITAQISQMLINIISQKLGPAFIKATQDKGNEGYVLNVLGKVTILSILFALLITIFGLILFQIPYFGPIFEKYSISKMSIIFERPTCR